LSGFDGKPGCIQFTISAIGRLDGGKNSDCLTFYFNDLLLKCYFVASDSFAISRPKFMNPMQKYCSLMWTIRYRFDVIETLRQSSTDNFSQAESAAFHGRKIVEGIAFACLVAIENGLKNVPRNAKGQWNAETIFKNLKSNKLTVLPSPSVIRQATPEASVTIEGIPERRLTHDDLIKIYQRFHAWLHEVNPYTYQGHSEFYTKKSATLWKDLEKLHLFVEHHAISIHGAGFYCVLRDSSDQQTKVLSINK
jgi:hypothetical protein